ncbi:cell wall hydrolase [Desulfotomaculum copahuensis]|uniref:Cell wall hydrolase n=1 Tax=Desulfotomaculum copahuensis TaxID=1838280 RepID=A0A1B7LHZ5_9FIRM|nr:cell wall hydrolase [Desulfotomaculum copahuensis]
MTLLLLVAALDRVADARHDNAVNTLSRALAGRLVVVDPGHGGVDPGAVGKDNVLEKDIVLQVARRLTVYLRQGGARVVMTREGDSDLADPEITGLYKRKKQDLARRVALANSLSADAMISIHVNSFNNPGERGIQIFTRSGDPASLLLARSIQSEMNRLIKTSGRAPLYGNYYIISKTKVPAVIVETGFISNPAEYTLLQNPDYQSKLAWCLYAGIVNYFAGKSTPDKPEN